MNEFSILVLDSLNNKPSVNKEIVIQVIRDFLSFEFGVEGVFSPKNLNSVYPNLPLQPNYIDCGVYLLQYVENFFHVSYLL